jgi:hypothetical protein
MLRYTYDIEFERSSLSSISSLTTQMELMTSIGYRKSGEAVGVAPSCEAANGALTPDDN